MFAGDLWVVLGIMPQMELLGYNNTWIYSFFFLISITDMAEVHYFLFNYWKGKINQKWANLELSIEMFAINQDFFQMTVSWISIICFIDFIQCKHGAFIKISTFSDTVMFKLS